MTDRIVDHALLMALTVSGRKEIKRLKATSLGAFIGIARACLEEGLDAAELRQDSFHLYGRVTPKQWMKVKRDVLEALRVTFPDMLKEYQKRSELRKSRIEKARANALAYQANIREAKRRGALPTVLNDVTHGASILQPQKAQSYRPIDQDIYARRKAMSHKSDATRLTD